VTRIPFLAGAAVLALACTAAWHHMSTDRSAGGSDLVVGTDRSNQPRTMAGFLTAVTDDVGSYWSKTFKASDLPAPTVRHRWIPAGTRVSSPCGDEDGSLGDDAAAYCPADDTIYISEKFATDIYDGALDRALPGSSQGYGSAVGDFAVAYIVAHEYGHEIQNDLGVFQRYEGQLPTMAFELQADCYAGTWAKSADLENRLENGDVDEAVNAALAVGDFDTASPGHHGTPEQRAQAWSTGFDAGDPGACDAYLDPSSLTSDGADDGTGGMLADTAFTRPRRYAMAL
jgi:predicted metalloprotease